MSTTASVPAASAPAASVQRYAAMDAKKENEKTLFEELNSTFEYALTVNDLRARPGKPAMRKGRDGKPDVILKAVGVTDTARGAILGSWIGSNGQWTKFQKISKENFHVLLKTGADYWL